MNHRVAARFERALNLVSLGLIVFLCVSFVSRKFETAAGERRSHVLAMGDVVPVSGINWGVNHRTLVLVLSVGCKFCGDSMGFYRALVDHTGAGKWQAVAVLPQAPEVGRQYLAAESVRVSEVRQLDLSEIGVSGTPTLFLVDEQGRLLQEWVGKLSSAEEADVAGRLGLKDWQRRIASSSPSDSSHGSSLIVTSAELREMVRKGDRVNIVDVRDRPDFARGRLTAALNIPADELSVRAPHELALDAPTVLYCRFSAACNALGLPSLCTQATEQLRSVGITNVRIIRDRLILLEEAGLPLTGTNAER